VAYKDSEQISDPSYLFDKVREIRDEYAQKYQRNITVSIEPGRYLIADSSVLLCRITATK
jgi:diaminopimelate decarboxylase